MIRLRSREAAIFSQPRERTPLSARMVSRTKLNKLAIFATAAPQFRRPRDSLSTKGWIWKASVAGLCGSVTHTLLMIGKTELGLLESFQPYQSLQIALGDWTGQNIHPLLPWLISYVNGSKTAGFAFANLYQYLPGTSGPVKGAIAGILGWLLMSLFFLPLLHMGPFAMYLGLGPGPGLFSLAMMLAYSVVMGTVYSTIDAVSVSRAIRQSFN